MVVAGSYNGNAALAAFAPASLRLYAQHDANYDVTAMADADGTVQERAVYGPYGPVTFLDPQWQPTTDSFGLESLFQGMRYDPATGLYHTPTREYSPTLGRWLQQDRGYLDGSNLYASFASSPTTVADANGLKGAHTAAVGAATAGAVALLVVGAARHGPGGDLRRRARFSSAGTSGIMRTATARPC